MKDGVLLTVSLINHRLATRESHSMQKLFSRWHRGEQPLFQDIKADTLIGLNALPPTVNITLYYSVDISTLNHVSCL